MTATTINKPDIVAIIEGEGIQLKHRGRNFVALCPFHSEKTPSFTVNPDRQIFKCFGCGTGGNVFAFLQKHRGFSFKEALVYLGMTSNATNFRQNPQEAGRRELIKEFNKRCNNYRKRCLDKLRKCNQIDNALQLPEHMALDGIEDVYITKDICEYHISILDGQDDHARFNLYLEVMKYE